MVLFTHLAGNMVHCRHVTNERLISLINLTGLTDLTGGKVFREVVSWNATQNTFYTFFLFLRQCL